LHTYLAESAFVIHTCRVNEKDRSQGQHFHGFFDGIGGRTGNVRNNRHLLPREHIQQSGFAGVSAAKNPNVEAKTLRG